MKENIRRWHNDVLAAHSAIMFDTLVHDFSIITDSVKSFTFEDEDGNELEALRGYLALKETKGKKVKYFIEEKFYDELPIRIKESREVYLSESSNRKAIIKRPMNPTPFRIRAEKCFKSEKEFIDDFADFEHTNPDAWTLAKITAIMGYVGKTFVGMCSPSEFGKSSVYEIIHSITKKSPVFQPRSIPGILIQVTGDGNIVFDEVHQSNNEVKRCMENFTLQVGGNKPVYINGAMKAGKTKAKYNVSKQSITFLYNTISHYSNPDEEFFDHFFGNNLAIDSRLLKMRLDGKLLEKFDRNFNIEKTAEDNKMFYMDIAKHLLYLKDLRASNSYKRRYDFQSGIRVKGRRKMIYEEITWMIDIYSEDETEYKKMIKVLDNSVMSYDAMIGKTELIEEEVK